MDEDIYFLVKSEILVPGLFLYRKNLLIKTLIWNSTDELLMKIWFKVIINLLFCLSRKMKFNSVSVLQNGKEPIYGLPYL
jgi:hypothetical protein